MGTINYGRSDFLNIGFNLSDEWDNKEVTAIGKFLTACANIGLVKYSPWWCTTYFSRNETVKAIRDAVKAMRQAVHDQPTFRQYERMNNA